VSHLERMSRYGMEEERIEALVAGAYIPMLNYHGRPGWKAVMLEKVPKRSAEAFARYNSQNRVRASMRGKSRMRNELMVVEMTGWIYACSAGLPFRSCFPQGQRLSGYTYALMLIQTTRPLHFMRFECIIANFPSEAIQGRVSAWWGSCSCLPMT
jgi:hypothetical protein